LTKDKTRVLQPPSNYLQLFTIILQLYYNYPVIIYNHITIILQLPSNHLQLYHNHPIIIYNVVIKGCGIVHIANMYLP
jgi:hypothetical protein